MDEMEFQEILEKSCRSINFSKIPGINIECIREYMQNLLTSGIDFNKIDIEWILSTSIKAISDMEIFDISLLDAIVDKETFEDYMAYDFGVINPLVYEIIYQAAIMVNSKLVTYESRHEFYSNKIFEFKSKLVNSNDDNERKNIQECIDYYAELLEALEKNKGSRRI